MLPPYLSQIFANIWGILKFFIGELIDVDIVVLFSISVLGVKLFYSVIRIFEIIGEKLASSVSGYF